MTTSIYSMTDKGIESLSRLLNGIGVVMLMVMMLAVTLDVIMRFVFRAPIEGIYEAVELMMAVVYCYGIAYTQRKKKHISVRLFVEIMPPKAAKVVKLIVAVLCFALCVLLTWQSFVKAGATVATGETTYSGIGPFGHVPIGPFVYVTTVACVVFTLELFMDCVNAVREMVKK